MSGERLTLNGEVIIGDCDPDGHYHAASFRIDTRNHPVNVVLTMGTFDLFHAGHVFLLEQCRKLAGPTGKVVVALNADAFVREFKGEAPAHTLHQRTRILGACRHVDEVVENTGGHDAIPTIVAVKPTLLVIGQDWALKDYYAQLGIDQHWLDDKAISLVYIPRPVGAESSTDVRRRVRTSGTR